MNSYNNYNKNKINYNTPQTSGNSVRDIVNTYSQMDKYLARNNRQIQSGISRVGADYSNQRDIYNNPTNNPGLAQYQQVAQQLRNGNNGIIDQYRAAAGLTSINNNMGNVIEQYRAAAGMIQPEKNVSKVIEEYRKVNSGIDYQQQMLNRGGGTYQNEYQQMPNQSEYQQIVTQYPQTNIWQGSSAQQSAFNTKRNQLQQQYQSIVDQLNELGHSSRPGAYQDGDYLNGWDANDFESYAEYFRLIQELNNTESALQDLESAEQQRINGLIQQDVGRQQAQKYLDTYAKMQGMGYGGYNQAIQANAYNNYMNNVAGINQNAQSNQQAIMDNYRQTVLQLEQQRYESNYQKAQNYYQAYTNSFNDLDDEIDYARQQKVEDSKIYEGFLDRLNNLNSAYEDMFGSFKQFDRTFEDDNLDNRKAVLNLALTYAKTQDDFDALTDKYSDIWDEMDGRTKHALEEKRDSLLFTSDNKIDTKNSNVTIDIGKSALASHREETKGSIKVDGVSFETYFINKTYANANGVDEKSLKFYNNAFKNDPFMDGEIRVVSFKELYPNYDYSKYPQSNEKYIFLYKNGNYYTIEKRYESNSAIINKLKELGFSID